MVQRTVGSGDDKTTMFWIPVRIPGAEPTESYVGQLNSLKADGQRAGDHPQPRYRRVREQRNDS